MSARGTYKESHSKMSQERGPKVNIQASQPKKSVIEYLDLLEKGEFLLDHLEGAEDELKQNPRLADIMQYKLHKYCQKDINEIDENVVLKISKLCYSHVTVSHFNNVDRFLGCVFYITNYLIKKEMHKPALDIIKTIKIKKPEILKFSKENPCVLQTLFSLHGILITSAVSLASKVANQSDANYHLSTSFAMESLKLFKFANIEFAETGKKVAKSSILYFMTVKTYWDENLIQFYKLLMEVLKILLPKMKTSDYFLFFLYKSKPNVSKKKSDSDRSVHSFLKNSVHLITLFLNSSTSIKKAFNKILSFFWQKTQLEFWICNEDIKVFLNAKHPNSKLYFILFSIIFCYGIQHLWKKFEKNWANAMPVMLVQKLLQTVLDFHKFHSNWSALFCSPSKTLFETCFGDLLTGNLQKVQYTVRLCLRNKIACSLYLVPIAREAFKLSMECVEYMNSIECIRDQRIFAWKAAVVHHRNMVEDFFKHWSTKESLLHLKDCSSEIIKEIVNSNIVLPFDFKCVKMLFQRWHFSSLKMKNYLDAMFSCVIFYLFYPNEEAEIMSLWLQAKAESENEIFEEITMPEFFKTCRKTLKEFVKNFEDTDFELKSVLIMELKAYSTCSPKIFQNPSTFYSLVNRLWEKVETCNLDLWDASSALSYFISAYTVGDNEKLPGHILAAYDRISVSLMRQTFKGKPHCKSLLYAANLTFSFFLYNVSVAEKSEGKMDTTYMVLDYLKRASQEKVKFGDDVDLNLTCDVIPSSNHLTVKLETNYLNELNKIVDLWKTALKYCSNDSLSELRFDVINAWHGNVKHIAFVYELFGEYQRAFTTWLMFYQIGKLCGNPTVILLGLTHLIENCADVEESEIKEEADAVLQRLCMETTNKVVIMEYFLAIASIHLKNKNSGGCLEYLTSAKKLLEGFRTSIKTYILSAKFWCLVSQFLTVYKGYEAVFGCQVNTDVRVVAFKAFSYANAGGKSDLIKSVTQSECIELILTMLDVNLWNYYLFGVHRQTNFMRFFLDDLYQIVQKLFLPTRTAEILVRLAEVDMICEKMADCQAKVIKLKSILTTVSCLYREPRLSQESSSPFKSNMLKSEFDSLVPRPLSPVRFLDNHPRVYDPCSSSPIHQYLREPINLNSKEHTKKCKCRLCQNLLIQMLTMNTIWLEGEIHMSTCSKQATVCYGQAFEVLNKLQLMRAEQIQTLRCELACVFSRVPQDLDFKRTSVLFHCARFFIKYATSESCSLMTVTHNVTRFILRVSKLLKKCSYEEKLLQWTFVQLKLFCLVLNRIQSNSR